MYSKFDKYDLFRAGKDCKDLWQKAIEQEKGSGYETAAKHGYFTIKNLIIAHGLQKEFDEWMEVQQ